MESSKFNKKEARLLIYGKNWSYMVYECNNKERIEDAIAGFGKPESYMDNFNDWKELSRAAKCYKWMLSALPGTNQDVEKPTEEENDWFFYKQLDDEHMVKDIKEIVAAYDAMLPDSPDRYAIKLPNSENSKKS